ncbi:anti-sigma factor family protein [Tahibacter sp. UC22_41]|uniref:anti-sigma factor family protein n=1 Tax=Tahibacter sp. UC22_41 TaxID=3350178 RepID=UPI0036DD6EC9
MNAATPASERIRAYLDGTMDEQTLEEFELALFDDPDLAEAVDAERLLRDGLREIQARRKNDPAPAVVVALPPRRSPVLQWLPLAASLALGVLIGALAVSLRAPAPATATTVTPAAIGGKTQFVGLSLSRNAPTDELSIRIPSDTPQLMLQFTRPQGADVRDYLLELDMPDGSRQTFAHLRPENDTKVSVGLAAAALPAGRYHARLYAIGNDGSRRDDQERRFVLEHVADTAAR